MVEVPQEPDFPDDALGVHEIIERSGNFLDGHLKSAEEVVESKNKPDRSTCETGAKNPIHVRLERRRSLKIPPESPKSSPHFGEDSISLCLSDA